jgi:hypothetical protein
LLADFNAAGIASECWVPRPGQILDAGFWARIVEDDSWPALAEVLVAWARAGNLRKVSITQNDNKIINTAGLGAGEVEKLLPAGKNVMAVKDKNQT